MPILATIYPAAAGIGLLLAVVQLLIWLRIRTRPALLAGAAMSMGAGVVALCEAGYLRAETTDAYQALLEVQNLGVAVTLVAMVWFVRWRLGTGRAVLLWVITLSWAICAVVNVVSPGNLTFATLDTILVRKTVWGETFGIPVGSAHQLRILADLTSLAIVIFVADASFAAARRGMGKLSFQVGVPILFFILVAGIHTPLVDAGVVQTPYAISLVFVAISLSLAFGLVDEVARGARLARELENERQRWDALLDGVKLAVVRIGTDGRIAYVNRHLEEISGRRAADLIGTDPVEITAPRDKPEIEEVLSHAHEWTTRSGVRRSLLCKGGETRELLWFSVSLRDPDGRADGIIALGQDITGQLAAEDARDKTEREIEKLSRALTMGEFASTFAHELSQPIAAVLSNAQTLKILQGQSGDRNGEAEEILGDILRDTRRARDLMNRVRQFMFNEAPQTYDFELGEMVAECLEMLEAEARDQGAKLIAEKPGYVIQVHAARLELQQVILNLVLNAIQATATNGGSKVVVAWRQMHDGQVEMAVEDDGPGLTEEQIETVFQPFVSFKSQGTGVGLAVVRRVAERHNGEVAVSEGPLRGAKFSLTLPIARDMLEQAVG